MGQHQARAGEAVSIQEHITATLKADAGLAALVVARVFPLNAPQPRGQSGALPYVTYEISSGERVHAMGASPGLRSATLELTAWAKTYAELNSVTEAMELAINRHSGTANGVTVQDILHDAGPQEGKDDRTGHLWAVSDFTVWFR